MQGITSPAPARNAGDNLPRAPLLLGGAARGGAGIFAADALTDARRLARALAQVIELRAPHLALALDLDRGDQRRVGLERALHAFAGGHLAHDERRVEAAVALGDDHAFERLHALPLALDHVDADDHGVAGRKVGHVLFEALDFFQLEGSDQIHGASSCVLAGIRPAAFVPLRSTSSPPASRACAARSDPVPASAASAGCSRGALTSAPPAPWRPRLAAKPPAACTAGNRAARRRTIPRPPRHRRRARPAAGVRRHRSTPSPPARRPRARSRRSTLPRRPGARATARPRPRTFRTAASAPSAPKTPSPCGDPASCPAASDTPLCRPLRFSRRRAFAPTAREASPSRARRRTDGHPPSGSCPS